MKALALSLSLLIIFSSHVQNASAIEYYVGALRNYLGQTHEFLLYITSPSISSVNFTVETNNGVFTTGSVNSTVPANISLPITLVTNNGLYTNRFNGIRVYSTDGGLISVLVVNKRTGTFGDYLAYPFQNYQTSQYRYYAVSLLSVSGTLLSEVLLVGNRDNTTVTIVPSETVVLLQDIQNPTSGPQLVTAGTPFTLTIHRMQTYLFGAARIDISGTSIVSDKPLTVVSGHECANIPAGVCCCQHLTEQIPPTVTWGRMFLLTPFAIHESFGPYYKIVAAESQTTMTLTCTLNDTVSSNSTVLELPGDIYVQNTHIDEFCYCVSDKPILVTQIGPSENADISDLGDPVLTSIPPIDQHQSSITLVLPSFTTIVSNYVNVATTMKGPVYIDGQLIPVTWKNISNSSSSIVGYGAQIPVNGSLNISVSHTITMQSDFIALVYGFGNNHGYSYIAFGDDANECSSGNGGCEEMCVNTYGSYYCDCRTGFQLNNGYFCSDIDECTQGVSGCEQGCLNTIGSYQCTCNAGYTLASNSRSCSDINECSDGTDYCSQTCVNTDGSYYCTCQSGYTLSSDNQTCIDINECNNSNGGCEGTCQNTQGSYSCLCPTGYILSANQRNCSDINECNDVGKGGCEQNCINSIGSYSCSCNTGYSLSSGRFCSDINECSSNNGGCDQICQNTAGSYSCACSTGFVLSPFNNCSDINECNSNNGGCQQICNNTIGSYQCNCNSGYTLNPDNRRCDDIDECSLGISGCNHNCANTVGSFTCSCYPGYFLTSDQKTCNDTNECLLHNGGCGRQNCTNTMGSYQCLCIDGYKLDTNGIDCTDIDECSDGNNGGCEQVCTNTIGSFNCSCNDGFQIRNGFFCSAVKTSASTSITSGPSLYIMIVLVVAVLVIVGLIVILGVVIIVTRSKKGKYESSTDEGLVPNKMYDEFHNEDMYES